ncbi:unnamed protein product [Ixodes pacificus]
MVSCGVAAVVCAVLVAVVVLVVIPAATAATTTSVAPDAEDADRRVREAPRRVASKTGAATMRVSGQRARPMVLDPRKTWQAFLRHSERTETRRPKKKIKSSFLRMQGPQGPPGPRGARGPPGANITRDEMFREFKGLLREVAERRVQLMAVETECKNATNCSAMAVDGVGQDSTMPWVPHLLEIDRASLLPRTQSSFFWELSQDVRARRGKELRVHPFHRPFSEGSFERGPGLNATRGLFRAPISGLYLFFGRVFVVRSLSPRDMMKQLGRRSDDVGLLVCTDSLCHKNLSLRTSKAFSEGRRKLTMTVNGPLMLRAGHQVSLWLWNRTPQSLTLQQGSQFSGFLVSL